MPACRNNEANKTIYFVKKKTRKQQIKCEKKFKKNRNANVLKIITWFCHIIFLFKAFYNVVNCNTYNNVMLFMYIGKQLD